MATDARETKHNAHLEVTEVAVSESPGRRRQGKFQPFRRLFGRRKKRVAEKGLDAAELKASFSTEEVCNGVVSDDEETNQHLRELTPIGNRALSHDSVFIPEDGSPEQNMSQENISDKVRNLQRQIAQNIKFGQKPPSQRQSEGDEGSSDEEEVPRSPLKVLAQVEAEPGETEPQVHGASPAQGAEQGPGTPAQGAEQGPGTPVKSPRSKRILPATGTIESINLDSVPQSVPRLDNTAAKHKLAVKPKNQRISRKHRRFTQEVCLPDVLAEEAEGLKDVEATGTSTGGQQRPPGATDEDYESPEKSKKQRIQEEERQESRRKRERDERERREREEALEVERKKRAEELRLQEIEEERCRKQQEEDEKKRQREDEERRIKEEEERRIREQEERRMREEEERIQREEEERRIREEQEHKQREEEERRRVEEQRKTEEEETRQRLRLEEEERLREEREEVERQELEEKRLREEAEERKRREKEEEERLSADERQGNPDERKRRAEELRWREMEERQRPFSFKVSSGEKQILFQKVNLTPVTPTASQPGGSVAELTEGSKASSPGGGDSANLPSSQYVPHTAILVTGAQLCGPAVNLDQIKDPACKSLLGLGDDKRAMVTPKSKASPERKSGKTKSLNESSDQSSTAVLAEWASIRSKIFKGAEEGKYEDYPEPGQSSPGGENQSPFPHTNLRKTMSASAKFSITPAKKKFSDSKRNSEVLSQEDKEGKKTEAALADAPPDSPGSTAQGKAGRTVRVAHRSEGCLFAKDLPSFLVPNPAQGPTDPEGSEADAESQGESSQSDERREEEEERGQDGRDRPSHFGIKLRRTNYSLRFHSEQPTEKRKKRYSAGDSFEGVPSPLTPIEPESAPSLSDTLGPASPLRESAGSKPVHATASANGLQNKGKPPSPITLCEAETPSKPSVYQRPGSSKPAGAPTPPPSPLPKAGRGGPAEAPAKRPKGDADSAGRKEQVERREESSAVAQLHRSSQGEEEHKEKKSFFTSISIPWREKVDRKTELIRREKPSLQSRHSLDSVRVQDKEAGPLWITLALQKQKGFREQQQTRDERRVQREAKLAEKQARDRDSSGSSSPSGSKGSSSPTIHLETTEEAKRPDTFLGRFERRDHLKKANTLPSSVTVEIADSTPSPPAVKDVSKRFPANDSPQVSTEPAWLALAKRKAKAWSDCPQIIK